MKKCWVILFLLSLSVFNSAQDLTSLKLEYNNGNFAFVAAKADSLISCCSNPNTETEMRWVCANALSKLGKFNDAFKHYEFIEASMNKSLIPEDLELNMGICLLKNLQVDLAYLHLKQYYTEHKLDYKAQYWYAECLYRKGEVKLAQEILIAAVSTFPDDPDAYYLLGIIATEKDQFEKAYLYFQTAFDIKPNLYSAKFNMGISKFYAHQLDAAEEIMAELALEDSPMTADVLSVLGEIRFRQHDDEGACEYWKQAEKAGVAEAKENYQKICVDKKGNPRFVKRSFVAF
jgi:tetratricopeptide (TPR) repeat protein